MQASSPGSISIRAARVLTMLAVIIALAGPAAARWPSRGGGGAEDQATDVVTSGTGAVYAVGSFSGVATFGRDDQLSLSSNAGSQDIFVVRLSAAGNPEWVVRAGGPLPDAALAITVDSSDDVYLTGYFHGTASFGGTSLSASGDYRDIFVAKLSSGGTWQWAVKAGSSWQDYAEAIAFVPGDDSQIPPTPGSVFVAGRYTCTNLFYDDDGSQVTSLSNGNCSYSEKLTDLFVARINTDGEWQWAMDGGNGSAGTDWVEALSARDDGQLYLVGGHIGSVTIGGTALSGSANDPETLFTSSAASGSGAWSLVTDYSYSATTAHYIDEPYGVSDRRLSMTSSVDLSGTTAPQLSFWSRMRSENHYDGGVLEASSDGGSSWNDILDVGGSFVANGYTDTLDTCCSNPMPGRQAWEGSLGWQQVVVDLGGLASGSWRFRWRFGTDSSVSGNGWWIDDLVISDGASVLLSADMEQAAQQSFVARLSNTTGSSAASWSWVTAVPEEVLLYDLAVDPSDVDRVALTGESLAAASFGSGTEDVDGPGPVAAQINSSGVWQWARGGDSGSDWGAGYGVAVDSDGNVYFAGSFTGTAQIGGVTLTSTDSSEDVLVAGLTQGGTWRWASGGSEYDPDQDPGDPDDDDGVPGRGGGPGSDSGLAISCDGAANLHVVGAFEDEALFGDDESVVSAGAADAFFADLDLTGKWFEIESWTVGEEVPAPAGAENDDITAVPDFYIGGVPVTGVNQYFYWNGPNPDDNQARLYALQPADEIEVHWRLDNAGLIDETRIVRIGKIIWPEQRCTPTLAGDCFQVHVAGAPVEVVPASGGMSFLQLFNPDDEASGAVVDNDVFDASSEGYSVVAYQIGDGEPGALAPVDFEVTRTYAPENAPDYESGVAWEIGVKLSDPFHDEVGRSAWMLNANAFYDADVHTREARTGPIIPVNRISPYRAQDDGKELQVVWYRRNFKGVYWAEKPVEYDCWWPLDPDKIIIASQLGSEVLGQEGLDPLLFPSMQIYQQPDVSLPGYNPNDEFALFAPSSSGTGLDALYALRSDFGNALDTDPTAASDPYVLLKYWDTDNPPGGAEGVRGGGGGSVSGGRAGNQEWAFKVYKVLATGAGYDSFHFDGTAGTTVSPPYPLRLLAACGSTTVAGEQESDTQPPAPFFRDYKDQLGAKSNGNGVIYFHLPLQPGFFYDLDNDDASDEVTGTCVPWLARLAEADGGTANTSDPIAVGYSISWPSSVPQLTVGETLLEPKNGLPDIYHQAAVEVVFDELVERNLRNNTYDPLQTLVRLVDPLNPLAVTFDPDAAPASPDPTVCYDLSGLPGDLSTEIDLQGKKVILGSADGTIKLAYALYSRLLYDDINKKMTFSGVFDDSAAGEPLLLLNTMTGKERDSLKEISSDTPWNACVDKLYKLSRNPNQIDLSYCVISDWLEIELPWFTLRIPLLSCTAGDVVPDDRLLIGFQDSNNDDNPEPVQGLGSGKALTAGFAQETGFVTLAFNNDASLTPLPVSLNVIRVDCLSDPGPPAILSSYQGEIKIIEAENIFDEQLTLRHSGDFAGASDSIEFEWYFHPDEDGTPPEPLPDPDNGQMNGWLQYPVADPYGAVEITIGGANIQTLSDNWYIVRYRGLCEECDTFNDWSLWAGQPGGTPLTPRAQLAEGWVKRVVRRLNPFEARVQDFHASPTNTFASMLVQLGERYEGDIALTNDPAYLNEIGLIEAYETVMRRAMQLSIDSTPPVDYGPANNAILLVASRITDFYNLLGNEAYSDAQDPTIGISTDEVQYGFGTLAPTIFNFENQVSSLLEEELILLRGRDDSQGPVAANPVYNRLFWNFTSGSGEVAYALSYNISDQDLNGSIDEYDARILFPQGHGDAWGHYLTGLTKYYQLLRHDFFSWNPQPEAVIVAGVPIQVDYYDERKFATTAAAKARAGAEVVDLTYRDAYVEDPEGQWQGYKDTDEDRAWGLAEWGRRAGMGAYFDWVTSNAILPSEDPDPSHVGIQRIDRTTRMTTAAPPVPRTAVSRTAPVRPSGTAAASVTHRIPASPSTTGPGSLPRPGSSLSRTRHGLRTPSGGPPASSRMRRPRSCRPRLPSNRP